MSTIEWVFCMAIYCYDKFTNSVTLSINIGVTSVRKYINSMRRRWNSTAIKRMHEWLKPSPFSSSPFSGLGTRLYCPMFSAVSKHSFLFLRIITRQTAMYMKKKSHLTVTSHLLKNIEMKSSFNPLGCLQLIVSTVDRWQQWWTCQLLCRSMSLPCPSSLKLTSLPLALGTSLCLEFYIQLHLTLRTQPPLPTLSNYFQPSTFPLRMQSPNTLANELHMCCRMPQYIAAGEPVY